MTDDRLVESMRQMSTLLGVQCDAEWVGRELFTYVDGKLVASIMYAEVDMFVRYALLGIQLHVDAMKRVQDILEGE